MKTPYTFAVLRYIHDVVSGEYANVGVALYSPNSRYLSAVCATTYGRVSTFFGGIEASHFKRLLRHVEASIDQLGERLQGELFHLEELPKDVMGWADHVLPKDDSSLQFAAVGGGLTDDPEATLEELYHRFVEFYEKSPKRLTRSDDDIWKIFRQSLAEHRVLARLRPKRIAGRDYEHEFPAAWKNGIWNASEAISFDLANSGDVLEKANRWLGRAVNLKESREHFKLHLLIGAPRDAELANVFVRARNILDKMPIPHDLITEDRAEEFAERLKNELDEETT